MWKSIFKMYKLWWIDRDDALINIVYDIFSADCCDFECLFYNICEIYSQINTDSFNNNFLLPILKKFIKDIENSNKSIIVEKFIESVEACICVSIEIDEKNENYIELHSNDIADGNAIIALEYLGFDYPDLIYTGK